MGSLSKETEHISNETEDIKKSQMEVFELSNIITEMKNSVDETNSRKQSLGKNVWSSILNNKNCAICTTEKIDWKKLTRSQGLVRL